MTFLIRSFEENDRTGVLRCIVELQEAERRLDPRLRPGTEIAASYFENLRTRCSGQSGVILVAEIAGDLAGFAAAQARVPYEEVDDPPGTFALISDLAVLPPYRHRGLGQSLIKAVEDFCRSQGATELHIGVLATNMPARALYQAQGFKPHFELLAKRL